MPVEIAVSKSDIERNILNAVKVLRHVHRETNSLIVSLDGELAGRGWQSLSVNKNTLGLWWTGAKLDAPDGWMATILSRVYTNFAAPRRVILVEIYLAPEDGGAPVVAMAGLSLAPMSMAKNLMADGWKWQQPGPWFNAVDGVLNSESMRRVVPTALHGRGRLVALCDLDKTSLLELVVKPVLELVQSVPME